MDTKFESWQLTEFNLKGQINLGEKFGLIKIYRSSDGVLVLITDADHGLIDQTKPTPVSCLKSDSILGFILDIGIQKEKQLAYSHGYYLGTALKVGQSQKIISQNDFDKSRFEKIGSIIEAYYQSGNKKKETEAIRMQLLFDTYNSSRLLFPDFYSDSYLGFMRILDALSSGQDSYDFATFAAGISSFLNKDIYKKLNKIYKDRVKTANALFVECLQQVSQKEKRKKCYKKMKNFDDHAKIIFACFYSAYQYRNKFVHHGFPFPDTIVNSVGLQEESGTAYLDPALGIAWSRMHRPTGLQDRDLIDIHEVVRPSQVQNFKGKYFQLLPTWHFLKILTREALLKKIQSM